ncbi:ABC transporter permease [Xylocopilactobacillus apis]|nr:ABC transporter permease [Xylocopilactobacillus apis]
MKYLLKKFRREAFKEDGAQLISLIIIVTIGVACFIGFSKSAIDLTRSFNDYYDQARLEDLEIAGVLSPNQVKKIQNLSSIKESNQNYSYQATTNDNKLIIEGTSPRDQINKLTFKSGRYPKKNEIAIDHLYFNKNKLKLGDNIRLTINGIKIKAKISGTIQSPKYLYLTENISEPVPNHQKYGFAIVPKQTFKRIGLPSNLLTVKINNNAEIDQLTKQIHHINQNAYVIKRTDLMSYKMIQSKLTTIKNISIAISGVFMILTIAITLISYSKIVANKKTDLAIFKTLGISKNIILMDLFLPGILTALVGSIIGSIIGTTIFPQIIKSALAILFDFPEIKFTNPTGFIFLSLITIIFVELIALLLNANKLLNETAANAMHPDVSKVNARIFLTKIPAIWQNLSFKTKLLVRNIASGKAKFGLSMIALAFCVTILISSFGLKFALNQIEKSEFIDQRNYDLSANVNSVNLKIQDDSSVTFVDHYSVVPTKIKDLDTHLQIINENSKSIRLISARNKALPFTSLPGVYVSKKLAQKLRLTKGSSVNLKLFLNNEYKQLKTVVQGIYPSYTSQGFYTTYEYLNTKNLTVPIQSQLIKARNINAETKKLNDNPLVKDVISKNKQAENYRNASASVNSILLMIVIIAAMLLFAVIYNISSINISERKRDIATEKVLGLSSFDIDKLIFGENAILVVLSTIIGSIISPLMYNILGNAIASDEVSFPANLEITSFPISIILIFIFLLLTSSFLSRKIKTIDPLSALNGFE